MQPTLRFTHGSTRRPVLERATALTLGTRLAAPRIVASAPARIINVSSGLQTPTDFDARLPAQWLGSHHAFDAPVSPRLSGSYEARPNRESDSSATRLLHANS